MAKINVDFDAINSAAHKVERYLSDHRQHMRAMEEELLALGGQWHGPDYQQVLLQWQQISSERSASGLMIRDLEEQAKLLRWAAEQYAQVQNAAIARAKRLVK